jgi:hypothetical protein
MSGHYFLALLFAFDATVVILLVFGSVACELTSWLIVRSLLGCGLIRVVSDSYS